MRDLEFETVEMLNFKSYEEFHEHMAEIERRH